MPDNSLFEALGPFTRKGSRNLEGLFEVGDVLRTRYGHRGVVTAIWRNGTVPSMMIEFGADNPGPNPLCIGVGIADLLRIKKVASKPSTP